MSEASRWTKEGMPLVDNPLAIYAIPGFSDPVSCFSHLLGAGVFAVLGVLLVYRGRGHRGRSIALAVYALCCVFLLSMSGTYHLLSHESAARVVLRRLDHAAIFTLIAGTFTPLHCILFNGPSRWGMLLFMWSMAAIGITLKTVFFNDVPNWLGLSFYLILGWAGLVSGGVLWRRYGYAFVRPLAWGGIAYTAGALFDFMKRPTIIPGVLGPHELFHIAVLVGIGLHWQFIDQIAARPVLADRKTT